MNKTKPVDIVRLKSWLENGEALLIDVREPGEYRAEHIAEAHLVPLSSIHKKNLPDAMGKKLVIHCKSGKRGEIACQKLLKEDPNLEVYNLEGGISAWANGGYPVEKSGKTFLPLDRQVQLVVGFFIFIGSILGYNLGSFYILIPAFFGIGLMFAGITGFCGLAMIMAKMPWNTGKPIFSSCKIKEDHHD